MHSIELEWIHKLQDMFRSLWMDRFFTGWHYVDSLAFTLIVVAVVWFLFNRHVGICLLYVFILSSIFNGALKEFFHLPRPCHVDTSVGILCLSSFGFPSGAAQTATILAGVMWMECQKRFYRYVGLLFAFVLCFSRIYLGVHFITDVLGGMIIGGFLLMIYWLLSLCMQKNKEMVVVFFPVMLSAFGLNFLLQYSIAAGVSAGVLLDLKQKEIKRSLFSFSEVVIAVIGSFCLMEGRHLFPNLKIFFLIVAGFWFSYLGSYFLCLVVRSVSLFKKNGSFSLLR